jgi:hypothetical protein
MIVGQLSLQSVPPEKREALIERLLARVKGELQERFARQSGYVCRIRSPTPSTKNDSARTWTLEWVCGGPYEHYVVQLSPHDFECTTWNVVMVKRGPFSEMGGLLGLPEAIGASLGGAIRWVILSLAGRANRERNILQAALEAAILPEHVLELAKSI